MVKKLAPLHDHEGDMRERRAFLGALEHPADCARGGQGARTCPAGAAHGVNTCNEWHRSLSGVRKCVFVHLGRGLYRLKEMCCVRICAMKHEPTLRKNEYIGIYVRIQTQIKHTNTK